MKIRPPAVAGRFYSADQTELISTIEALLGPPLRAARWVRIVMAPNSGMFYGGSFACAGYRLCLIPELVVVLGPNTTGLGKPLALPVEGIWRTPLGDVQIDSRISRAIMARCELFEDDWEAHRAEHSVELQLVYLQARAAQLRTRFRVVTVTVGTDDLSKLITAGRAIAEAISDVGMASVDKVLFVVSSEMNHYEPAPITRAKDLPALDYLLEVDPENLYREVTQNDVSMNGYGPAVMAMVAARFLGTGQGRLLQYGTSADITGDNEMAVGYASVLVDAPTHCDNRQPN